MWMETVARISFVWDQRSSRRPSYTFFTRTSRLVTQHIYLNQYEPDRMERAQYGI